MLWTGDDGRVEIEVMGDGPDPRVLDALAVRDAQGRLTSRMRLPKRMYFIVTPARYGHIKLRKIVGDVKVARNREEVEAFARKYGSFYGDFGGPWTAEAIQELLESLSRSELE
jgi:hypothetical protein